MPTRDDTQSTPPNAGVSGANVLLNDCEAQTVIGLKTLFRRMFERADDLLFEMADKGDSVESQEVYVEGMRTVRIKRAQMERAFAEEMRKAFKVYLGRTGPELGGPRSAPTEDLGLSLLEEDELEESLALTTMGDKAADRYADVLKTLSERFARLNPAKAKIDLKDLPFSPQAVVEALRVASGILSVAIRVKVIVYKLFDKMVVNQLGEVYHDLDERLAKAGVAPELKVAKPSYHNRRSTDQPSADDPQGQEPVEQPPEQAPEPVAGPFAGPMGGGGGGDDMQTAEQLLQTLHQLLTRHRGESAAPGPGMIGGGHRQFVGGVGVGVGGGSVLTGNDLVRNLTQLQLNMEQLGGGAGGGFSGGFGGGFGGGGGGGGGVGVPIGFSPGASGAPVSDVKKMLLGQFAASEGEGVRVQGLDEDVIDVVGMLFEFILADTNLHPRAKATISRLQIPMVKVALIDKSFFTRKQHPARRLLNSLAKASLRIAETDAQDNPTLQAVETIVNRVLEEFDDDVGLFDQLLGEFQEIVTNTEMRSQRMEDRQVKTVEGQEKLEFSKKRVEQDIAQRIATTPLPKGLRQFIDEKWRHHMLMACLKAGPDGEDYQSAVALMEKLIWSVEPKQNPTERQQVVDALRPLLTDLRDSLAETFMDPEVHKAPFFKELQAFQLAALRGQDPAAEEREEMGKNPPPPPPLEALPTGEVDPNLPDEVLQEIKAQTTAQGDQLADDDFVQSAVHLGVGTWMELDDEHGKPVRVKLSWRSPLSARCLFVNSRGLKELEVTTDEIAKYLRDGKLKVLDGAPLVDRGLDAVVDGLKAT